MATRRFVLCCQKCVRAMFLYSDDNNGWGVVGGVIQIYKLAFKSKCLYNRRSLVVFVFLWSPHSSKQKRILSAWHGSKLPYINSDSCKKIRPYTTETFSHTLPSFHNDSSSSLLFLLHAKVGSDCRPSFARNPSPLVLCRFWLMNVLRLVSVVAGQKKNFSVF